MNFKEYYNKEESGMVLLKDLKISESLAYHLDNKISLSENIYRIYSDEYFNLIKEARSLYNQDALALNDIDADLVESSIGEKALYNGREVYLEAPIFISEDILTEATLEPDSINTTIYVDMDGVLADLRKSVSLYIGKDEVENDDYNKYFLDHKDNIKDIFKNLPKFDSTDYLIRLVSDVARTYKICSCPLRTDRKNSSLGKSEWLDSHLEIKPEEKIFTGRKESYATTNGKPNILIDDKERNIRRWEDKGGIGILYSAEHDNLDTVVKGLERAKKILSGELKENTITEAKVHGKNVKLNRPFRTPGGPKKFAVYVKTPKGTVKKVTFGDPNMRVRNNNKARAKSFRARHKCSQKKDRTTAGYWSCNISRYRKALGLKSSRTW
jgi:5'(3')-deoxyribonucleotidase